MLILTFQFVFAGDLWLNGSFIFYVPLKPSPSGYFNQNYLNLFRRDCVFYDMQSISHNFLVAVISTESGPRFKIFIKQGMMYRLF